MNNIDEDTKRLEEKGRKGKQGEKEETENNQLLSGKTRGFFKAVNIYKMTSFLIPDS